MDKRNIEGKNIEAMGHHKSEKIYKQVENMAMDKDEPTKVKQEGIWKAMKVQERLKNLKARRPN